MAVESGQENNGVRQDSLLHKLWVRLAIVALVVLLAVVLTVYLRLGLRWYLSPTTELSITQRRDLVQGLAAVGQALAVGLIGAAGFIGLAFTWRNLRQTRESTQRTLELTEQGQITERFTRAIDQLGATDDEGKKKLEIRLGGIYALERIARDSPERDYSTVMEVLTAYVRENAHEMPDLKLPSADILAVLRVLGRRDENRVPAEHRRSVDLRGTNFQRNTLRQIDLRRVDLREASLQGADLQGANLQGANLQGANLERADCLGADLREAKLGGANLASAILIAYLQGANFFEANLHKVNLNDEYHQGPGRSFRETSFFSANLQEASLYALELQGASFLFANLQGADLRVAWLRGATFRGANLQGADLQGTDLQEADLKEALNLTQGQIEQVVGNKGTMLPENLKRPEAWRKSVKEQWEILP
jgi:uncharacterized protein YjbI with pentapeptide repeats